MKYSLPVLKLCLSKFGDQDSREDSNAILSKATAFHLTRKNSAQKQPKRVSLGLRGSHFNC